MELADYHQKNGNCLKALKEYIALIYTIPLEIEFYEKAATLSIQHNDFKMAYNLLQQSLRYDESFFALKWIDQILLKTNNLKKSINYMSKAAQINPNDSQLLFNLCRAYYTTGQIQYAEKIYSTLLKIDSNSPYIENLKNIRRKIN